MHPDGTGLELADSLSFVPPEAPPPSLDLGRALADAWRNNPQVRQAELAASATEYDIRGARAGYYPYLQAQVSQGDGGGESSTTLYLVQPLWNGGLTRAQVDAAKADRLLAMAELNRIRLELGHRLLEAYFNVAQAQEQQRQWLAYVSSLRALLGSIERRAAEGAAPDADVQTAGTRLKQAEAGLEAARALESGNRAQLANLLSEVPGELAWPGATDRLSDSEAALLYTEVPATHPDRLTAVAQIQSADASLRSSKAALWPEVSLQHREQVQGVEFDPTNSGTLLVMQFQSGNSLKGLQAYRGDQARLEASKASLKAAEREIVAQIEIDLAQLRAASLQISAQEDAAASAVALVDSFLRQYEVGRKTWLEVLNVQREANEALLQTILMKRNYWYYSAKYLLDSMQWDRLSPAPAR